jgi:hypothetical protein
MQLKIFVIFFICREHIPTECNERLVFVFAFHESDYHCLFFVLMFFVVSVWMLIQLVVSLLGRGQRNRPSLLGLSRIENCCLFLYVDLYCRCLLFRMFLHSLIVLMAKYFESNFIVGDG